MNTTFNIEGVIDILKKRKIFTSEADLQLELAKIIKEKYKDANVRLEYCPDFDTHMHIDILVIINGKWIPIELKYKTKELVYTDNDDCKYILKEQGANDCGCYDYIKDIKRIETIKENKEEFEKGYTIFITNDELYKKGPRNDNVSYAQFSLEDEREISAKDKLMWKENKSVDTQRKNSIILNSSHRFKWKTFSTFNEGEIETPNNYNNVKIFYILINEIH